MATISTCCAAALLELPKLINLLSSPVNSPPKARHVAAPQPASKKPVKDLVHFSSDDFDINGLSVDFDFPIAQPTKKRRLSPDEDDLTAVLEPRNAHVYILSDDDDLPPLKPSDVKAGGPTTSIYDLDGQMSDPIGFSSSAPEPRIVGHDKAASFELSDDLPEDILGFSLSQPTTKADGRGPLSERTANLLANLHNKSTNVTEKSRNYKRTTVGTRRFLNKDSASLSTLVEGISSSPPIHTIARFSKNIDGSKDAGVAERAVTKAAKERERDEEKERKRLAKEQKAKEKQEAADIAQVNKSKTDKKISVTEMIVDLSPALRDTSTGRQISEYMKPLGVESTFFEEEIDLVESVHPSEHYGNLVKWRRKLKAKYNEDAGHWEPLANTKIEDEPHILVHLTATDFAALTSIQTRTNPQDNVISEEAMTKNIDTHVSMLRKKHKDCKPIYLIEGLEAFLRKNKTAKNRAYTAAVLSQLPPDDPSAPPASSQARRKKKPAPSSSSSIPDYSHIDTDLAESLLLHLQIHHSVLIHHTASPSDTASWIRTFTEHISTIPYRHERMSLNDAGAAFCMDVGQVKTGDDPMDTYVKMLQEVQRVTPAMAYGIANLYPNVRSLVKAFREEGQLVLEDVKKGANRDGAVTNSRLGPAVSKRLYKVFMGKDEWNTDGIA